MLPAFDLIDLIDVLPLTQVMTVGLGFYSQKVLRKG